MRGERPASSGPPAVALGPPRGPQTLGWGAVGTSRIVTAALLTVTLLRGSPMSPHFYSWLRRGVAPIGYPGYPSHFSPLGHSPSSSLFAAHLSLQACLSS